MRHAIAVYLGESRSDRRRRAFGDDAPIWARRLWDARQSDNCFARYQNVDNLELMLDAFLFMSLNVDSLNL